ncbi:50S ribosomal protein L18e [Candidatus Pacearchaeota archaeon]|nr:50S ribosomal protein L18e [Candidatus Pacearchaeota archaeon]
MKSKTLIEKQLKRKTNPELVETIILAKKKENWVKVAGILSGSRGKRKNANLEEIEKKAKEGETIVVPGKVLSQGELNKKIKIVAGNFSELAKEKLLKSKKDFSSILEEIKLNPEAKGIKIFE